mgnify:CR=1 FL=1
MNLPRSFLPDGVLFPVRFLNPAAAILPVGKRSSSGVEQKKIEVKPYTRTPRKPGVRAEMLAGLQTEPLLFPRSLSAVFQ